MRDPYEILGVAADATADDIKAAFRKRAAETHPDKHPEAEKPQWTVLFQRVNAAHQILGDPEKRAAWDRGERPDSDAPGGVADAIDPDLAAVAAFLQEEAPAVIEALKAARTEEPVLDRVKRAASNLGRSVAEKTKTPEGQQKIRAGARIAWDFFLGLERPVGPAG